MESISKNAPQLVGVKMSKRRIELMNRVLDGEPMKYLRAANCLYHFDRIPYCDDLLQILLELRLTGRALEEYIEFHGMTPLKMHRELKRIALKMTEAPKLLVGRDYVPETLQDRAPASEEELSTVSDELSLPK